ncbi:hypothetical protein ACFFOS_16010 [Nocardioides kongjuensis]|uniref:Uncharacterized protein n=1 Tax=Nocardioides kongjuensis TaxID=349522 RepID=A0A852S0L6_9ACTN|nr:hypothetical protein [Nocardioides kongjuensis]NYD32362.1 hypothetical protein [Nocardioides kongjuensis]
MTRRTWSIVGAILLTAVVVMTVVVALGRPASDRDLAGLLEPICPEGRPVEKGGRASLHEMEVTEYAACDDDPESGKDRVEAFIVAEDPAGPLLGLGDGWESGDGTGVTWAIKRDGDEWIAVVAIGDDFATDAFEDLQDRGFHVESNPSSPLEGYDDAYGG